MTRDEKAAPANSDIIIIPAGGPTTINDKAPTPYEIQYAKHHALFELVEDKSNWKLPTHGKHCASRAEAQELADAITFFVGGAEIDHNNNVFSKGYYFYCGA